MKNETTKKELLKKIRLALVFLLLLNGIPHLSFSQSFAVPTSGRIIGPTPIHNNRFEPVEQNRIYDPFVNFTPAFVSIQSWGIRQPIDNVSLNNSKNETSTTFPTYKLRTKQIKKIVGNDKVSGKDAQGHQLYQNSKGETYYLLDNGAKVILK